MALMDWVLRLNGLVLGVVNLYVFLTPYALGALVWLLQKSLSARTTTVGKFLLLFSQPFIAQGAPESA